ncbi:hypothetical protein A3715_06410 [Oleiphilus sp. HI0009]|uniref:cell envelope integrity protein TolA n=3 Tax=Oleiphilus TaxID=141450 RepID=UPI0007C32FCD|nr:MULTISPECIES: cell envelope integrity protein TolA [unclassified Oleiphilus]KZX82145.1 hypothetical protein A3715_06410 [Oleiphilus sp. HI0009]KZY71267.1 hypothetical protein A3739_05420 [Oleiphilus sp. HI0067]KZY72288.1 hypothetical protein A3738_03240 [Oleiphilus sp. HI0066]
MIKKANRQQYSQVLRESIALLKQSLTKGHRRYLTASVVLHLVVVIVLSWSWSASEAVKTYVIPASIEARVLTAEEIDQLPYKKKQRQEEQARQKKKQDELRKKKEAQRKKELAKKKAEAERKKKIAKAKQEEAKKKKLAEQKRKAELEAQRKKREQKKKQEQAKRQEPPKPVEAPKPDRRLEKLAEQREKTLREQRMAERLKGIQDLKESAQSPEPVFDLDEKTRYLSIIRSRIESRWFKPPGAQNDTVVLRIRLFPTGELQSVDVIDSSGNSALDQSALAAVNAVGKFEVPKETAFFEKYFRSFQMSFKPEA